MKIEHRRAIMITVVVLVAVVLPLMVIGLLVIYLLPGLRAVVNSH